MELERAFDALNLSKGKRVVVELKNKKQIIGVFKVFDQHINAVLEDAEEWADGEIVRKLGTVFIRGDMIVLISPQA